MNHPDLIRAGRRKATLAALAVCCLVAISAPEAFAKAPVFGVARPEPAISPQDWGPLSGLFAQIAVWQSELYRLLSGLVRDFRTDPLAGLTLVALSFAYGVLHAAGPGHGKAVISSYLLATGEGARRGLLLSFAAAGVQALSAIAIVSVLAGVVRASSAVMTEITLHLELASYSLIAVVGAWLAAGKSRTLLHFVRAGSVDRADCGHVHHADASCEHMHAVDPRTLTGGAIGLRRGASAVAAVGIRPCSGAILVLVFALSQGVYQIGLAAVVAMAVGTGLTVAALAALAIGARNAAGRLVRGRPGLAAAVLQGIELLGAVSVLAFGMVMLGGTLAAR